MRFLKLAIIIVLLTSVNCYSAVVESISFVGLKWCKERFVKREVLLKPGEEFSEKLLKESVRNLLNTHLFYRVKPVVKKLGNGNVDVVFYLEERFPVIPVPKFQVKSDGSYKVGMEVRDYNLSGMGNKLFVGYTKWENTDFSQNRYMSFQLYRFIKQKGSINGGVYNHEDESQKKFELFASAPWFLDKEKVHTFTPGVNYLFIRDKDTDTVKRYLFSSVSCSIDKTTDYVYYISGTFLTFALKVAMPEVSSTFTGSFVGTYSRQIHTKNVDSWGYSLSSGTKFGAYVLPLSSGIPGYSDSKSSGKRFVTLSFNYRRALIDKSFFVKPKLYFGALFPSKDVLLTPGIEAEVFWAKLVDGIIKFSFFRGIGSDGSTQTSLKFGFRW